MATCEATQARPRGRPRLQILSRPERTRALSREEWGREQARMAKMIDEAFSKPPFAEAE